MIYALTPGLMDAFPAVDDLLAKVRKVACKLDKDIHIRDLRVEARRNTQPRYFTGWAYPLTRFTDGNGTTYHRDGLIRMQIGALSTDEDITRLYAHELRHIGQFHRGRARYGAMSIAPLTEDESEADADEFELRVLERVC